MKHFPILFLLVLSFFSCSQEEQKSFNNAAGGEELEQFVEEFDKISSDILDTRELTFLLRDNGFTYNSSLLNELENADDYLNAKEQCLNIGVFAADLNYMTVFEKNNQALSYVDAIYALSNALSIDDAFNKVYLTEIVKNDIPNYRIKSDEINDVFEQAKEEIKTSERAQISALIATGAWVEGMFHTTSMATENWPHDPLAKEMWGQCGSYHKIKNLLEIYKQYPPCDEVYLKFLELEPAIEHITKGDEQHLKENINSLHGIIFDLREFIISH